MMPESLGEVLDRRARRTPPSRLAIDIIGGVLIVAAAAWARMGPWLALVGAGAALAAYGTWARAAQHLAEEPWRLPKPVERRWRLLQAVTAPIGIAGFVLLLFALLGVGLGRLIS
jgi:hypothetical protein